MDNTSPAIIGGACSAPKTYSNSGGPLVANDFLLMSDVQTFFGEKAIRIFKTFVGNIEKNKRNFHKAKVDTVGTKL